MDDIERTPDSESAADDAAEDHSPQQSSAEFMKNLPSNVRESFEQFTQMAMSVGPAPNPIATKITSEHVSEIIKARNREVELDYGDRKHRRRFSTGWLILGAAVVVSLVVFLTLTDQPSLVGDLMQYGIGFIGGIGAGIGYSEIRRRREE